MTFGFCLSVTLLLLVWSTAKCVPVPDGAVHMECHDRYFKMAVDLSFAEGELRFEAVDETGVHPILKQYAAKCGYSIVPLPGHVELRASYFSCHTDNKGDQVFTFNFNLIVMHEGREVTYAVSKTCSPSLPWSPREVTCELNYMEVSVRSEVSCPSGTKKDDWNSLKAAHSSTTSDWQVLFHRAEEQLLPMNLSEARKQDYVLDLTDGRLLFRTPYGQPESFSTEVDGVPVEVVHATLFSRQSWVVLMVDMVAACSMFEGSYDHSGYVVWKTTAALYPSHDATQINIGFNGRLVTQPTAMERGYIIDKDNSTILISIPYNAEEAQRKSFVTGDLYEYYTFNFYLEQILVDDDHVETRVQSHRTLVTSLLPHAVFSDNLTVLEERIFSVYLRDVPEDVELAAVQLNGHEFTIPLTNASMHTVTEVVQSNNTHGYSLRVPFDSPVVINKFSKEDAVFQYSLDIIFTLTVMPENEPFYHLTSIVALFTDVSPPVFDAVCSESGISFKLDHQPFHYLWEISIGSDLLTSELAAQHGYIMSNSSQSLLLHVPLFTHGYEYKNVTLKEYFGTFEILVRDHETSEIQSSTIKTCPFNTTTELIVCSTDGRMTVVADLSPVVSSGVIPARTSLKREHCGPIEADNTRVLFSFPLHTCGSIIKVGRGNVTYRNEIFYNKNNAVSTNTIERVTVQCTYPLAGLHRLFSVFRFESDAAGVGSINYPAQPQTGLHSPKTRYLPVFHPRAQNVRFPRVQHNSGVIRGPNGWS